jgi:hypothetical protein
MRCDRCGARFAEEPSCGKSVHLDLPSMVGAHPTLIKGAVIRAAEAGWVMRQDEDGRRLSGGPMTKVAWKALYVRGGTDADLDAVDAVLESAVAALAATGIDADLDCEWEYSEESEE